MDSAGDAITVLPESGLAEAVRLFTGGASQQGADCCRELAQGMVGKLAALRTLSNIYTELGLHGSAVTIAREAVRMAPGDGRCLHRLGCALTGAGELSEALESFSTVLGWMPFWSQAHEGYAEALHAAERYQDAFLFGKTALQLSPDSIPALECCARVLMLAGQHKDAADLVRQGLQHHPERASLWHHLGLVLKQQAEPGKALQAQRRASQLCPEHADYLSQVLELSAQPGQQGSPQSHWQQLAALEPQTPGSLLVTLSRRLADNAFEQVLEVGRAGVALFADRVEFYAGCAAALMGQGKYAEALEYARQAQSLSPDDAASYNNMAIIQVELGQLDAARENYHQALALTPDNNELRFGIGLIDLTEGYLPDGWQGHAHRWVSSLQKGRRPVYGEPEWDGQRDIRGQRLLLYTEQGFGDSIQFVRYVRNLGRLGCHLILHCQPPLIRLFEQIPEIDAIWPRDMNCQPSQQGLGLPPYDCQQALMSLPLLLGTDLPNIPDRTPYLRGDTEAALPVSLSQSDRMRVGLVWSASQSVPQLRKRDIPFEQLAPILDVPGASFFSLQMGAEAASANQAFAAGGLVDLSPVIEDFTDTARLLEQLDLVITIDTSIAHLSGALNRPTWLLLPLAASWRWLLKRHDSPWYPSMRLYRQQQLGDWSTVVAAVAEELRELVGRGPSRP